MAHSAGNENVELVVVGDDVSVPHSRGKMVGRRCLAGITLGTSLVSSSSLARIYLRLDPPRSSTSIGSWSDVSIPIHPNPSIPLPRPLCLSS